MRTPISGTDGRRNGGQAGFTLIELLAVLAILALAITAFTYGGTSSLETARFRSFLVKTAAAIGEGRSEAMRSMRETVFLIDLKNRRLGYPPPGDGLAIPPGVDLTATVAEPESYKDGVLGIRFYPAGNTSGGTLHFTFRNQGYEIRVNWLTGNVVTRRV